MARRTLSAIPDSESAPLAMSSAGLAKSMP